VIDALGDGHRLAMVLALFVASIKEFVRCRRIVEQSLELYTCSAASADSEMPPAQRNSTLPTTYNELATLMSVTGEPPIRACLFLSAK